MLDNTCELVLLAIAHDNDPIFCQDDLSSCLRQDGYSGQQNSKYNDCNAQGSVPYRRDVPLLNDDETNGRQRHRPIGLRQCCSCG